MLKLGMCRLRITMRFGLDHRTCRSHTVGFQKFSFIMAERERERTLINEGWVWAGRGAVHLLVILYILCNNKLSFLTFNLCFFDGTAAALMALIGSNINKKTLSDLKLN